VARRAKRNQQCNRLGKAPQLEQFHLQASKTPPSVDEKSRQRANLFPADGGIAQLVERLVRNEFRLVALTFAQALLSALS
jgi:hypothetical protein